VWIFGSCLFVSYLRVAGAWTIGFGRLHVNIKLVLQLKYGGGHPALLDRSWALRRPIQSAFRGLFTPLNIHPNTKSAFVQSAVKALFYNVA
jgi:hypothetical protein